MRRQAAIIIAVLLAAVLPLAAQMAVSHAPTATAPGPSATVALQAPVGRPVARVNGAVLTDRDLLREEYTIFPYARQHNGVPKAMEEDIRKGAMKMIEFEELVYQEAVRRGMTVVPARMQKAEAEFRQQFTSPVQYQRILNEEFHGSPALLREKIRRSLLIEDLLKADVEERSVISVAEAKAYFLKNPERFRIPESYAIQTISIMPPANANPAQLKEARKRADDAIKQAKATETYEGFGALAEKISEDDWRVMMGDRKAMDITKLPPEVTKVVQSMQIGQVSDLIPVGQNFTIVRLNAHIPAGMQKFDAVKDSLRKEMQKNKTEQLRVALDKKLRQTAKVEEL
ncbi:MAG: peptidylprolyl isomerase [Terriglobales bacterium]